MIDVFKDEQPYFCPNDNTETLWTGGGIEQGNLYRYYRCPHCDVEHRVYKKESHVQLVIKQAPLTP